MLVNTYNVKLTTLPLCNICRLSLAKVENVVKPPQNPIVSSKCHDVFVKPYLLNRANITPKIKHPSRLTVNIPHGNILLIIFFMREEI
jgi:hypothetical protein